jgi:hypothetical protein
MKKFPLQLITVISISFFMLSLLRCSKSGTQNKIDKSESQSASRETSQAPMGLTKLTSRLSVTCSGGANGTWGAGLGQHTYPASQIDVSCMCNNTNFTLICDCVEVPNRFTVKDANGITVASTGWIGFANYPGPWGGSLSNPNSTQTLTIPKTGTGIYTLIVETSTGPQADSWNVGLSCNCPANGCGGDGGGGGVTCTTCGGGFSGTYTVPNMYFQYPTKSFCLNGNKTITVLFDAVDIPNKFIIYDGSGIAVLTSPWMGRATYYGPWGPPFSNTPFRSFTFTTKPTNDNYTLKVETQTGGNQYDSWNISINCPL